ncbi:MAG: hypothetical protein PHW84_14870, partial [Methanosarcina sp.]|nr:hypothetical protein [Methanosarcina sp.]
LEEAEERYKLHREVDTNPSFRIWDASRKQKNSINLLWKKTPMMRTHTIITDFSFQIWDASRKQKNSINLL